MTGFVVPGHICWFAAKESFIIIINVEKNKTVVLLEECILFRILCWIEKHSFKIYKYFVTI